MFILTKNQLEVFRAICLAKAPMSVPDIVSSTNYSNKTVYRITETLNENRFSRSNGDRGVRFVPSTDIHAAALKKYVLSNEHPLDAIKGSKLLVLLSISYVPKSIDRIAKETKLKEDTVRVLVWDLRHYGIVDQKGSKIMISPTDVFMSQFLKDYSKGVNLKTMDEKTKSGIMLWNDGLEFIFSASSLDDHVGIDRTGISAMADYGLQFVSETNYYHCSYWHSELRAEDVAIHNILINQNSSRGSSYSILLLKKNGFDPKYLLEEARHVGIIRIVKEIVEIISGKDTTNPFLPSRNDMEDLYQQYGVK
jgi:hypothetical protein